MIKLSEKSLDFAKNHIQRYYDSDFFPKLFEFEAIWLNWDDVVDYLTQHPVSNYPVTSAQIFAAPKPNGDFRIVHQLDPINAIIYTALTYEIASSIESSRVPQENDVACSYRIQINEANGAFFGDGNGFEKFLSKNGNLSEKNKFVLVTDITDFYNQIYLHRLQNAIQFSNSDLSDISKSIERFLLDLNTSVSKGIPVGPAASIIMAEAIMIDIDNFIIEHGLSHTRYVDDIRIFSNSEAELKKLLESLCTYLYNNHRLTLSSSKTELLSSEFFVEKHLKSPENEEKTKIHEALAQITSRTNAYEAYYEIEEEEQPDEKEIRKNVLMALMEKVVAMDRIDLGLARHILRRCRRYRIRIIVPMLLENFDFFAPVINDVVLYLNKVTNPKFIELNTDKFKEIIKSSKSINGKFVKYWLEYYFVKNPIYLKDQDSRTFVYSGGNHTNKALAAINTKAIHWVRDQRGRIGQMSPIERRSYIYSLLILPRDEKNHLLELLERNTSDFLEKIIIKYAKSK